MSARQLHLAAAMVIAASLLPGCPCASPDILFADEFEDCTGTCGWSVEGGGSADVTSTLHTGEHGLRLTGEVIASKAIQNVVPSGGSSHAHLTFVSDCRSGLSVILTSEVNGGPPQDTVLPIMVDSSKVDVDGGDLEGVVFVPFTADVGDLHQNQIKLTMIKLHVVAAQACTVDLVLVQTEQVCD